MSNICIAIRRVRRCYLLPSALVLALLATSVALAGGLGKPAPEFTQKDAGAWINSPPMRLEQLRGHVTLIDFWTFDCWNCYRSFPWLKALESKYQAQGLRVVGIHTPEFAHERVRDNVAAKVKEFGLHHPVMMDNDFAYWKAMGNRYWPAFYLLDKRGVVQAVYIGETHADSQQARKIEANIQTLLAEQP